MAFYDDVPCPVCGETFGPDDDVVVCPDCGTPHHRACWEKENQCVNQLKHGDGFQFQRPAAAQAEAAVPLSDGQPQAPAQVQCPACGFLHDSACAFCPQCGLRCQPAPYQPAQPQNAVPYAPYPFPAGIGYAQEDTAIDGESAADVAQAVGPGAQRYLKVFVRQEKKHSKTGWNWSAFFFSGYWLLHRKCYKTGFLALLIQMAVVLPFSLWMAPEMKVYYDLIANAGAFTPQLDSQITQLVSTLTPKLLILVGVLMAVQAVWALFGDYIYKRHILTVVKEERAAYETAKLTPPAMYNNVPVPAHDIYYVKLITRGGINPIAIVGGFLFYSFGSNLLAYLITLF